ncbi:MAG: GAF domain-containing protein [Syntrophales bacterium]|nr:GAF domain-containing protein [Syntrophales bacterium]
MNRKFNIIGLIIVILPILTFSYIIQQSNILLGYSQFLLFAMVLLLVLAGLSILRYIFDSLYLVVEFLKKAGQDGDAVSMSIGKDISDLSKISASFSSLLERFEKATDELNQRIIELNAVKELTEVARKTLHVDELLKLVLEKAMQAVGVKNGSVFLVDPAESEGIRFVAAKPEPAMDSDKQDTKDYSLIRSVISSGKSLIIRDIENDPRTLKANDPKYGAPSFLGMPIYSQERIIAVLNLANKEKGGLFSESDERILSIMLGEIGFALENAFLHLKVKDHLSEIKDQNVRLEQEIRERRDTDEKLKQANIALQESNQNLTKAYEWMRDSRDQLRKHFFKEEIGFLVDREGIIQSITERVLECTGKSRGDLILSSFLDLLDEAYREDFRNGLRQAWMGISRNIPVIILFPHESERILEATLTRLTSESKREMLIILR